MTTKMTNGEAYATFEGLVDRFIAGASGSEKLQWEIVKKAAEAARTLGEANFETGAKKRGLIVEGIALSKKAAALVAGH